MGDVTCQITDCNRPVYIKKRQLCKGHYVRWQKYGDPLATGHTTEEQRFWSKVDADGDCWVWMASDVRGYGQFKAVTGSPLAHRWSYEHLVGPVPAGLTLDHLCRNRRCVNPDHLDPVTSAVNTLRGGNFTAINARKSACPNGHPYDRIAKNGARMCSICRAEQSRRSEKNRRPKNRKKTNHDSGPH